MNYTLNTHTSRMLAEIASCLGTDSDGALVELVWTAHGQLVGSADAEVHPAIIRWCGKRMMQVRELKQQIRALRSVPSAHVRSTVEALVTTGALRKLVVGRKTYYTTAR